MGFAVVEVVLGKHIWQSDDQILHTHSTAFEQQNKLLHENDGSCVVGKVVFHSWAWVVIVVDGFVFATQEDVKAFLALAKVADSISFKGLVVLALIIFHTSSAS